MRRRLRQNATNVYEIYIGRPIYIYRTSNMYIRRPISILDVRYLYPTSDIPVLALALALALAEVGYCISDVGYRYRTSYIPFATKTRVVSSEVAKLK